MNKAGAITTPTLRSATGPQGQQKGSVGKGTAAKFDDLSFVP